ncbi:MAG TPA: hypothetical protein VIK52_10015 [Opitutaceae bacterium]
MRFIVTLSCLAIADALCAAQSPQLVWETDGFIGPESIVLDEARGEYYVSNMGTFGKGATPDDGKEQLGHISTVAFADKSLGRIGTEPVCHVDGLEPDGAGGYTVTDWLTGDVLHVTADGETSPIMNLGQGTADHAYLIDEKLLLIPQMMENMLSAWRWLPAE